jgi:hypothetical protein
MSKKNQKNKLPTQPTRMFVEQTKPSVYITPVKEVVTTEEESTPEVVTITNSPAAPRIIQYKIVSEKNGTLHIQNEIEQLLKDGWLLQGGVATSMYSSPYETVTLFSQSLTKGI